jgi:hypothetical protein
MTSSASAKTMTQEARFVTTKRSQHMFRALLVRVRTKVADYAGDIAAAEDVTFVEHDQRNRKSETQMDIDEVNLHTS